MAKLTAIIPTFNEEHNIERALKSVDFADEIIVIDSFSSDKTVDIVKQHSSVKLLQREFDDFSTQKNYAIQKAQNEWVFLLDADEEITENLKSEILQTVKSNTEFSAFYVYRNFFFKQKKLYYSGWQRDKVIRLFKKDKNEYLGKVHEVIKTNGEVGFLKHKLNHYSYKNYHQYRKKLQHYAELQAEELLGERKVVTPYHLFLKPFLRLFIQFFVKFGLLDGRRGFVISFLHSYGVFLRYIELLKLKYKLPLIDTDKSRFKVYNKQENLKPDVSIVIVNYKSWKHLENCLNSLKNIKQNRFSLETIVVDNFSNDGKLDSFSNDFPEATFIQNTGNNGFANGCNLGAKHSNSEYILFLNPDTLANEEAIFEILEVAKKNESYGIVSSTQVNSEGKPEEKIRVFPSLVSLFGVTRALYKKLNSNYKKIVRSKESIVFTDWVSGSLVLISKDWFTKIKGWNEDYWMYFEDVDLSKKIVNNDGKVALLKDVSIVHNHGGASRINVKTSSLTKSEVIISRHVYVANHFKGIKKSIAHFLVIIANLFSKGLLGFLGMLLYFIPKLRVQWHIFVNLIRYYFSVITNRTWLSPRSMNFKK